MGHQAQHTTDTDELLAAHRELWCHALGYIKSMALKCALDLRIPDIIQRCGGTATLGELVAGSGLPASSASYLRRVMRTLTAMRIFALSHQDPGGKDDDGAGDDAASYKYKLTPTSRLLLSEGKDDDASDFNILSNISGHVDQGTVSIMFSMCDWMKNPHAADLSLYQTVHGRVMWKSVEDDAATRDSFYKSMDSDTRIVMHAVLKEYPEVFQGLTSLVDVGGGRGTASLAINAAFPRIKCTVMDLPHVVAEGPAGTALTFVGGDMFEYIPPAEALLLKWILHDWDDAKCIKILERCKEAISGAQGGGKVIIIDTVIGRDDTACDETLVLDLHILSMVNGAEREEHEWRKIIQAAGFRDYKITHTRGIPSIIEVYP